MVQRVNDADDAITSSGYSTSWGSFEPWKAFNGVSPSDLRDPQSNCWTADENNPWIQYEFEDARYFTKLEFTSFSNYADAYSGEVIIKASNDAITWTDLGSTNNINCPLQEIGTTEITLNDNNTYKYIRLCVTGLMGQDYEPRMYIDEIYIYGGIVTASDFVNVIYKKDVSRDNPILECAYNSELIKSNYCYIEDIGYYYYITNVEYSQQRLYFTCSPDLLMTYKNDIMNNYAIIERQELVENANTYLNDDQLPVLAKQELGALVFDNPVRPFTDSVEMLIIVNGD